MRSSKCPESDTGLSRLQYKYIGSSKDKYDYNKKLKIQIKIDFLF